MWKYSTYMHVFIDFLPAFKIAAKPESMASRLGPGGFRRCILSCCAMRRRNRRREFNSFSILSSPYVSTTTRALFHHKVNTYPCVWDTSIRQTRPVSPRRTFAQLPFCDLPWLTSSTSSGAWPSLPSSSCLPGTNTPSLRVLWAYVSRVPAAHAVASRLQSSSP